MRNKKYDYTGKAIKCRGRVFRQIVALSDVSAAVHKGDIGGYIEHASNLSQSGTCWIDEDCVIGGNVVISGTASVHNSFIIGTESEYIQIEGWSEITHCNIYPRGGNVLIADTIMTGCYIIGECVLTRSTIDRSGILNSCIAECIISDSEIKDTVIYTRIYYNDIEC